MKFWAYSIRFNELLSISNLMFQMGWNLLKKMSGIQESVMYLRIFLGLNFKLIHKL